MYNENNIIVTTQENALKYIMYVESYLLEHPVHGERGRER